MPQTSAPLNDQLYLAAKERLRKPRKRTLSNFARPPQPKPQMSSFRRQQSY
jgi:hypothetical protein